MVILYCTCILGNLICQRNTLCGKRVVVVERLISGVAMDAGGVEATQGRAAGEVIELCLCTFRRPQLGAALSSMMAQRLPPGVVLRITVADNDATPSALAVVERAAVAARAGSGAGWPVRYIHAPYRNISVARNACLDAAEGDWIAFIDDDETAPPDWLARLLAAARAGSFDAVFGPAVAVYPDGTPGWIRAYDHHSNRPVTRGGVVQTGHTCNALMRWRDPAVRVLRFAEDKGRTGGEDTDFFHRLWRCGARLGIAPDAPVHEAVERGRLSLRWLGRRKFNAGQAFGENLIARTGRLGRAAATLASLGKTTLCVTVAGLCLPFAGPRNFWALRGVLHLGAVTALLGGRAVGRY
jgi:succinoglycan biosynthesis protein ExoM